MLDISFILCYNHSITSFRSDTIIVFPNVITSSSGEIYFKEIQMKDLAVVDIIIVNNEPIEFKSSGNEIYTDSLTVARVFEKRHGDVLRIIEAEIVEREFASYSTRIVKSNYIASNGKSNVFYYLDQSAFTDLIMNLTGAKAKKWKREYRLAFEAIVESHRGLTQTHHLLVADNIRLKEELKTREQALLPKTRETLDNMRRMYFKKINNYFISKGESEKAFEASLSRVYNMLHILVVGDIAVNILRDRVAQGIKSHNSGHQTATADDHLRALNYYTYAELEELNNVFNGLLKDVSKSIDSNIHLTPARVQKSLNTKLLLLIEEQRDFYEGMGFKGKLRDAVNIVITEYAKGLIETDALNYRFNSLKDGRMFIL